MTKDMAEMLALLERLKRVQPERFERLRVILRESVERAEETERMFADVPAQFMAAGRARAH